MGDTREVRIRLKLDSDTKELVVTERDVKKLGSAISGTESQAKKLDASFMKAAKWGLGILGVTSLIGTLRDVLRGAVAASDEWKLIEGRIDLVSASTQALISNQHALYDISQETFTAYGNSADLFVRISNATKEMDIAQRSVLDVTETVNKALIVSAASAQEQSSTITQLGQGLASGVLRGEEFNSIMENGNRIARALADGLGVTLGQLRSMAEQGELTSERVVNALLSQKSAIDNEFARMPLRIEQSFTTLDNSITRFIGQADTAVGASNRIAESIRGISETIDGIDMNDPEILEGIDRTMATLSRTIDMYNVLYETVENGAQISINGIAQLMYGTLGTIAEMIRRVTEGLNAIGLSSDETLAESLQLEIELYEAAEKAQKSELENRAEIVEALEKANVTIEERIDLYRKEREERKKNDDAARQNTGGDGSIGSGYTLPGGKLTEVLPNIGAMVKQQMQEMDALEQKRIANDEAEGELQLQWFRDQEAQAKRTSDLMDQIWLASADGFEKKVYDIAQKWEGLLQDIENPELLAWASNAISNEIEAAASGTGWQDVWTQNAAQTFTNAIQDALDGSFDFSKLANSIANAVAQVLSQAGPPGMAAAVGVQLYEPLLKAATSGLGGKAYEGGIIGTLLSPFTGIGAFTGSILGSLFGNTKKVESGISVRDVLSEDYADLLGYNVYKKSSIFGSSKKTKYYDLAKSEIDSIVGVIVNMDNALENGFGILEGIKINAGNYAADKLFNEEIPKQIISAVLGSMADAVTTDEIYGMWKSYAESIDSNVYEAMISGMQSVVGTQRNYQEWYYGFTGQDQSLLKYRADYLQTDLQQLESALGVSGITTENYLARYQEAVSSSLTPEMIDRWGALGEALIAATEASKAYEDALGNTADRTNLLKKLDDAYLGQYSPLSLLDKTAYANNIAYLSYDTGDQSAVDAQLQALQAVAASATRDEQLVPEFAAYTKLLSEQAADATRQNIVDEIRSLKSAVEDLKYATETNGNLLSAIEQQGSVA